jgi:hypothetical protein
MTKEVPPAGSDRAPQSNRVLDPARLYHIGIGVQRVAIDETAAKRGHDYITLVVDMDSRRVAFVADGRSADTVRQFADHLEERGGDASRIKQASIDMSPAFIAGVTENLTEAEITFDRFHVMKLIGEAIDEVRRAEIKARPELKGTRYVWTKNEPNLTPRQSAVLDTLASTNLKMARAWRMRLAFQDIYAQPSRDWAELFFDKWTGWARRSRLEPMKAVARTAKEDISGAYFITATLKNYGVTHVFFMESVLRQSLIEMENLGITHVLAHSEAAAVYMADGYARIARRSAVCMAQSVGAANLAAGLQDPFLGCSPVVALTGKKLPNCAATARLSRD